MKPDSPLQYPSSSLFDNSLKMISSKTGFPSLIELAIWNGGKGTEQLRLSHYTNQQEVEITQIYFTMFHNIPGLSSITQKQDS